MSNKTTIQSHNTRLQALIDTANSLPDAGGSGNSVVEVTISTAEMDSHAYAVYLARDGSFVTVEYGYDGETVEVLNGIVYCSQNVDEGNYTALHAFDDSHSCVTFFSSGTENAYLITNGDMTEGTIPEI